MCLQEGMVSEVVSDRADDIYTYLFSLEILEFL